jgi:hypothetical protein
MNSTSGSWPAFVAATALCALVLAPTAQAEDFFSALFGAFGGGRPHAPSVPLPFVGEGNFFAPQRDARPRGGYSSGAQAYCVRTCDGRYFPISASDNQSRAASCNSFCPASDTKVVYGSNIDEAVTDSGKPYSELPNAFRYRNELVAGCTCNGKDQVGLAPVKIENDPTLRKGDIVAGSDGLVVANRGADKRGADKRGASLNFSPVPEAVRSRYRHVPVVAAE